MRITNEAYQRLYHYIEKYRREIAKIKTNFSGSSVAPFVGRFGYPNVSIGILAPPSIRDDAWVLDAPKFWYDAGYTIPSIVEARAQLIHPRQILSVTKLDSKIVEIAQELAMAKSTPDTNFHLRVKPSPHFFLDFRVPPIGAPALLEKAEISGNVKISHKVETVVSDELKTSESVQKLYQKDVDFNQIVRMFSVGLLGLKPRLVPTRWSITAVDDITSKWLIDRIKDFQHIGGIEVFHNEYLGNHFEIILIPREWNFEMIECWKTNRGYQVCQDWEDHFGRRDYASDITGAYYAARLGVCEYLDREKRQASVLVLRYIKPEYDIPCGVWVIRETVRNAFLRKAEKIADIDIALSRVFSRIPIRSDVMLSRSMLLREIKLQRKIHDFKGQAGHFLNENHSQ